VVPLERDESGNLLIPVGQLKVGMYVLLPLSWDEHPFLKSNFRIRSEGQIGQIAECGLKRVPVDPARSSIEVVPPAKADQKIVNVTAHTASVADPKDGEAPVGWESGRKATAQLLEALNDHSLPPERKSRMVYENSLNLMQNLLETPSPEALQETKGVVGSLTDMILHEDQTARNLLKITSHDFYTYTHSVNVGVTSLMLTKALFGQSDAHDLHELGAGFFLHDLGKVRVDPEIINKPARLNEQEMQRMRTHPYQGYKLLKEAGAMSEECRIIVMQHHELSDGNGYPKRLKEKDIHIYARICAIADVFDALTAERSYKKAMTTFEALRLMKEKMSHQFDRELFGAFVGLFR
jgi:HD-GYP domain-containing protein (c-di-GMP phosphodiesterase class II)